MSQNNDTVLQEWYITTHDSFFGICVLLGPFVNDYKTAVSMIEDVKQKLLSINPNTSSFQINVLNLTNNKFFFSGKGVLNSYFNM